MTAKLPSLMRHALVATLAFVALGSEAFAVKPYKNPNGQVRSYRAKEDFSWDRQKLKQKDSTKVSPYRKSLRDLPSPFGRSRYSGSRGPRPR